VFFFCAFRDEFCFSWGGNPLVLKSVLMGRSRVGAWDDGLNKISLANADSCHLNLSKGESKLKGRIPEF